MNSVLEKAGMTAPGWFNDPAWSKPALTLLALWGVGDLMVVFMAALLDVPAEQYEAAQLDGASAWQRFRYVTLPNISPIVMFAVVTGVIQTMQYYAQPLIAGKVASGVIQARAPSSSPATRTGPRSPSPSSSTTSASSASTTAPPAWWRWCSSPCPWCSPRL